MTRLIVIAIAFLAGAIPTGVAFAQSDLSVTLVTAGTLSTDQQQQISTYVETQSTVLLSGNRPRVEAARDALVGHAANPAASTSFLISYSQALLPKLRQATDEGDDHAIVNALNVAASLATDDSLALLNEFRQDERPVIRFAAVSGFATAFHVVGSRATQVGNPERMVSRLREDVAAERDPAVFSAYVNSLVAAAGVEAPSFLAVRSGALNAAADALSERISLFRSGRDDPLLVQVCVQGSGQIGQWLQSMALKGPIGERYIRETSASAGKLGMALLDYLQREISGNRLPILGESDDPEFEVREARRQWAGKVADIAEGVLRYSRTGGPDTPLGLGEQLRAGTAEGDQLFTQGVASWKTRLR